MPAGTHRQVEALGSEAARERQSSVSVSTRPASPLAADTKPAGSGNKVRRLLTTGLPAEGVTLQTAAAQQSPHAKEDATRLHKVSQLFDLLLEHVLVLPELGVTVEQLADPMVLQRFRDTTMTAAARLSVQRLGALISSFRRWLRYCNAHGLDPRRPTPLQLADFLREAPELEPWEFINLLTLLKQSHGAHRVLVAQMLMVALGCIRFEHLQRSHFVGTVGPALEFDCAQGKARKQGSSRGALHLVGVDFAQAQAAGFNRLRRFLPTLANIFELPDLDLQAIGNWCEIPCGGGRDAAVKKSRRSLSMGVHYAASKVLRSLQVKQRCVDRLLLLFHKKSGELARTETGCTSPNSWMWAEVAELHQLFPEAGPSPLTDLPDGSIEVAPGGLTGVGGVGRVRARFPSRVVFSRLL
eukprot:s1670_g4.t1